MEMIKAFKAARGVGTPLLIIRTPDPASTEKQVVESNPTTDEGQSVPVLHWDIMRGIVGLNPVGKKVAASIPKAESKRTPADMLEACNGLPKDSILFAANIHLYWDNPRSKEEVRQGVWNLRDSFKASGKMFIGLVTAGAVIPLELTQDVLTLDEPLPTGEDLAKVVKQVWMDARTVYPKLSKEPDEKIVTKAVDALVGLASFQAEQRGAMCIGPTGFDFNELWEGKRQVVEQIKGLSVARETTKFRDIAGCDNSKNFFTAFIKGNKEPDGVVFIDEIEKHFAGFGSDLSGVTTKQTGAFMSWMEAKKVTGSLFIGHPGCSKTFFGQSIGNEAGVPTIILDFSAMESALVGSSGDNLRSALKVIEAMFKRPLFIGTCNGWFDMPTALRRRFPLPVFFFDLMAREEREACWAIWIKNYKLPEQKTFPNDEGWTGAEIRNCCDIAYRLSISLEEAGKYIVPVCQSDPEGIRKLREMADGKFISASYEGKYNFKEKDDPVMAASRPTRVYRALALEIPAEDIEDRIPMLPKVGKDKSKYDA